MDSRTSALRRIGIAYVLALVAAVVSVGLLAWAGVESAFVQLGVADLVATLLVFGFSVRYDNSSVYDPYWSVIPIWLASWLAWVGLDSGVASAGRIVLVLGLVWFWGVRLTHNWARGWTGFDHEDWRYRDIRAQTGRFYWVVSLLGIHLFPTVLVFLGCLPIAVVMLEPGRGLGWIDALASVVSLGAIVIEMVADNQLRDYVVNRKRAGETMVEGIWGWSRHPNYFGEMGFWWGMWLFGVAAVGLGRWWMVSGALAMTLLFNFVSIPMIERRMARRRGDYEGVQRRVSRVVPWFPKRG